MGSTRWIVAGLMVLAWAMPSFLAVPVRATERHLAGGEALPWAPPAPGYRITLEEEGFYRLTYADLLAAGLPLTGPDALDPRTLKLYNAGSEVAIEVAGETDGQFDANDSLTFFGQAVSSKYTRYNVYWLTYGGGLGLRMGSRDGTPTGAPAAATFRDRLHMEANVAYVSNLPGDDHLERYVWPTYLYPPTVPSWEHPFSLVAPAGVNTATLLLRMYSRGSTPTFTVNVLVNNTLVGSHSWPKNSWTQATLSVSGTLLNAGTNTVKLTSSQSGSLVYIDWIELEYDAGLRTASNALPFSYSAAGTWQFAADGFGSDGIHLYDVSDPWQPERITGGVVAPTTYGYAIAFEDTVATETTYWALADSALRSPVGIAPDTPSNLQSTANGADYIIITHRAFYDAVLPLRDYRAGQGYRAVQVDLQDVYDEFGYGLEGVLPIHDFLAYTATHWQAPKPKYVLLVGDGHYDPKDNEGYGRVSYLPPYLAYVDPWIGETAADNRYVMLSGDDVFPDMMLGRFPVNSVQEAEVLVAKTIGYETNPSSDWKENVLFVADNADGAGNFPVLSDGIISCCVPTSYTPTKVYFGVTHTTPTSARDAIVADIDSGQLIVNYIGHAGVNAWASEPLFTTSDIGLLNNPDKLPIMLPMTCYDGHFHYPYPADWGIDSLGEMIVRADGRGAVASWSPSGLGVSTGHDQLNRGFLDALFRDGLSTLGEATLAGKQRLYDTGRSWDLIDTYHLFGDPALQIMNVPTAVVLTLFEARPAAGGGLRIRWETASEVGNLGFNLWRSTSADGPLTQLNQAVIPSQVPPGSPGGGSYEFVDTTVAAGVQYFYWLEDVGVEGVRRFGPLVVTLSRSYLPLIRR